MRAAIMQPYFLPYVGYFQLIGAVDLFIVYDDIKYTKKGWINRNRMLLNGEDAMFSLPLRSAADSLDVKDREIAPDFDRKKFLARFHGAYRTAPQFAPTYALLERVVQCDESNLFRFLHHSIVSVCAHLGVRTEIRISSDVGVGRELAGQERVIALCEAVGADVYVNPIGGVELYSKDDFRSRGITLQFLESKPFEYRQFDAAFVPWLSIVDVLMFNPIEAARARIAANYDLI